MPQAEAQSPKTLREFCLRMLESGSLETKLLPPAKTLEDRNPEPALAIARPSRDPELQMQSGAGRLPRPRELSDPKARATCLARFAHHELMAAELFAWALLRWPKMPLELRNGLLHVLAEEQDHCRLYLSRLHDHDSQLSEHALSDYFWKQVPAIDQAPAGPLAFLAAMGLTLEQGNLDFTLLYRDAFRKAGDEKSAQVCERVHEEEITHVRMAAHWLKELSENAIDDLDAYEQAVPFPLSLSRAKGRRFDIAARRRAGLSERFIAQVQHARSLPRHPRTSGPKTPVDTKLPPRQ
mgnify:CR=1 FL=1